MGRREGERGKEREGDMGGWEGEARRRGARREGEEGVVWGAVQGGGWRRSIVGGNGVCKV